ncbi:ABC transporter permease [candidate division KSB1 bacterium]
MRAFVTALRAEIKKIRGTRTLHLAILIPLVGVALFGLAFDLSYPSARPIEWLKYATQLIKVLAYFVIPVTIYTVIASLINIETESNSKKHLFSMPVSRSIQYTSKLVFLHLLVILGLAGSFVSIPVFGMVYDFLPIGSPINGEIPWLTLVKEIAGIYLLSWFLLSFHFFLSWRLKFIVLPFMLGISILIFTPLAMAIADEPMILFLNPYMLAQEFLREEELNLLNAYSYRIIGGIIFVFVGCFIAARRDVLD